jgi:CheY-like chemotaxis protein
MFEILYVEDDDLLRGLYAEQLREAGFRVREARLAEEGLNAVSGQSPDLVLLDLSMPPGEMSGIELLVRLREQPESAAMPVVLFSGLGNILSPEFITSLRVAAVVSKPAKVSDVVDAVTRALITAS